MYSMNSVHKKTECKLELANSYCDLRKNNTSNSIQRKIDSIGSSNLGQDNENKCSLSLNQFFNKDF